MAAIIDDRDSSDRPPRSAWAVWAALVLVLSPVLYALSIGPAIWLQGCGVIHPDTTRLLFAPLVWICESFGPLNDLANAYIDLWRYL
jgi:hypothetical protein